MKRISIIVTLIILALIPVAYLIFSGEEENEKDNMTHATAEVNMDGMVMSENGLFHSSFTSEIEPIPVNQMHTWTLHLTDAEGQPIEGAEITIDGGMPAHAHGLPTAPQVTEDLGDGNYKVEGVRFNMSGEWVMNLHINKDDNSDDLTFEFTLHE